MNQIALALIFRVVKLMQGDLLPLDLMDETKANRFQTLTQKLGHLRRDFYILWVWVVPNFGFFFLKFSRFLIFQPFAHSICQKIHLLFVDISKHVFLQRAQDLEAPFPRFFILYLLFLLIHPLLKISDYHYFVLLFHPVPLLFRYYLGDFIFVVLSISILIFRRILHTRLFLL